MSIIELNNTVGKLAQLSYDSNTSPSPKKAKHMEVQQLVTTSSNAILPDDVLDGAEHLDNQQSTNSKESTEQ